MLGVLDMLLNEWYSLPPFGRTDWQVRRVRLSSFRAILRQNAAFFDREEHSTGTLTQMLGQEATAMAGLSGLNMGAILTVLLGILGGCILAYLSVAHPF